jgi:hypothetical protein
MWKLHVKYQLLSDFNDTWIFSTDFRKKLTYQVSSKFVQYEPSYSMRTDAQTDIKKLTVAFRNFAKAPKMTNTVWLLTWGRKALSAARMIPLSRTLTFKLQSQVQAEARRDNSATHWPPVVTWRWQKTWKLLSLEWLAVTRTEALNTHSNKVGSIHPPSYSVTHINTSEHYPSTFFSVFKLSRYLKHSIPKFYMHSSSSQLICQHNQSYAVNKTASPAQSVGKALPRTSHTDPDGKQSTALLFV